MDPVVRKWKLRVLILACLLPALPVSAAPAAGDHMLQAGFGFFVSEGDADTGTAQGELGYAYMLRPHWEIGARQLFSYAINDPQEDVWTGSTTATLNYYPWSEDNQRRWQPFFGVFAGLGYSDVDATGAVGPTLGLKYFLNDRTFVGGQWHYEFYTDSLDAGDETTDFEDSNMSLTISIGIKWGGR